MKIGEKYRTFGEIHAVDEEKGIRQIWLPGTILTVKEKRDGYFTLKEKDSDVLALPLTPQNIKKWGKQWLQIVR
ncbi:MAG: hypothetical protein WC614_07650 [bacterium]